jgi:hypothetical protein
VAGLATGVRRPRSPSRREPRGQSRAMHQPFLRSSSVTPAAPGVRACGRARCRRRAERRVRRVSWRDPRAGVPRRPVLEQDQAARGCARRGASASSSSAVDELVLRRRRGSPRSSSAVAEIVADSAQRSAGGRARWRSQSTAVSRGRPARLDQREPAPRGRRGLGSSEQRS